MLEKKKKLNMTKSDRHAGSSLYLDTAVLCDEY